MTMKNNSAEGGSNGTTVTVGNSGGGSGDAYNVVTINGSSTLTYDSSQAMHGTLSYKVGSASGVTTFWDWTGYSATSMAFRFYVRFSAVPSVSTRIFDVRDNNATPGGVGRVNISAAGKLVYQTVGSTLFTSGSALSANTWYRVEGVCSNNTGVFKFDYYLGDSGTPVETGFSNASQVSGTSNTIATVRMGDSASSTFVGTIWYDDFGANDGSTTYIGPAAVNGFVTAVPATASTVAQAPAVVGQVVVSGGGPAVATVAAVAPTVSGGANVTSVAATVAAAALAPTVSTTRSSTVTAVAATASAAAPAPVVAGSTASGVNALPAVATGSVPAPVVTAVRMATVNAVAAAATVAAPAPVVNATTGTANRAFFDFF